MYNTLKKYFWVYRNKITNKLFGVVHVSPIGKKKGDILLSYITGPFTLAPGEYFSDPHSNYWECREIARLFSSRGYAVDCINASAHRFVPRKPYLACIDIQQDLERLFSYLPKTCKKIIHIDNPFYKEYNQREKIRLDELLRRRGVAFTPKRQVTISNSTALADFLEGFGNEAVFRTYDEFKKPIFPIPISVSETFDYPKNKNFERARKSFVYFGGGGAILKGLDLTIEAFASMPHLRLHLIGPAAHEKEFEQAYAQELALPNIMRHPRPKIDPNNHITVGETDFMDITNMCGALIYPSAAEGTSGAVIQAIHAGLIPIVTPETGLNSAIGAIILNNPTVESVREAVQKFSELPVTTLKEMSFTSWSYVRKHHTKETFSKAYGEFIDTILKL